MIEDIHYFIFLISLFHRYIRTLVIKSVWYLGNYRGPKDSSESQKEKHLASYILLM